MRSLFACGDACNAIGWENGDACYALICVFAFMRAMRKKEDGIHTMIGDDELKCGVI